MVKKLRNLMAQMRDREFLELAADDAINSLESKHVWYAKKFTAHREERIDAILQMINTMSFPKKEYKPVLLKSHDKDRIIYPQEFDPWSIIFHAMKRLLDPIVEKSSIVDSSAGIKGRGQHYGAQRVASLLRRHKKCDYYSQSDLKKFYYSIPHSVVMRSVRRWIADEEFVKLFELTFLDFVWAEEDVLKAEHKRKLRYCSWAETVELPDMGKRGVIIGGPLCQWVGNLVLMELDHKMKEIYKVKAYHRHCDDIIMLAHGKEEATKQLHILDCEMNKLGLVVKANSFVAPIKDERHGNLGRGINYVGYVFSKHNMQMRPSTKKRFAKKIAKVKSRKRRREIAVSYYGIAKWGKCKNLWRKILNKQNMAFADFGIKTEQIAVGKDGKRMFDVQSVTVQSLAQGGSRIVIHDFEAGLTIKDKGGKCSVLFSYADEEEKRKFITSSSKIIDKLVRAREMEKSDGIAIFPQETKIKEVRLNGGRYTYDIE